MFVSGLYFWLVLGWFFCLFVCCFCLGFFLFLGGLSVLFWFCFEFWFFLGGGSLFGFYFNKLFSNIKAQKICQTESTRMDTL